MTISTPTQMLNDIIAVIPSRRRATVQEQITLLQSFLNPSPKADRGAFWKDEKKAAIAKKKLQRAAEQRRPWLVCEYRSTGEQFKTKSYAEVAQLVNRSEKTIQLGLYKNYGILSYLVDDDVLTITKVVP